MSFHEERSNQIQQYITEIRQQLMVSRNYHFLKFIEAPQNTNDFCCVENLTTLAGSTASSVLSVYACTQSNTILVGCGNTARTRGEVVMYRKMNSNSSEIFQRLCSQQFKTAIAAVVYEPLRGLIIVGSSSGAIVHFKLSSDEKQMIYFTELNIHHDPIVSLLVDTTIPDRNIQISCAQSGTTVALNMKTGKIMSQFCLARFRPYSMTYHPYEQLLFIGGMGGTVRICTLKDEEGCQLHQLTMPDATASTIVKSVAIDIDRRLLYVAADNCIHVWRVYFSSEIGNTSYVRCVCSLKKHCIISSMQLLNAGEQLIAVDQHGGMILYDIMQGSTAMHPLFSQHTDVVEAVRTGHSAMLAWIKKRKIVVPKTTFTTRDDTIRLISNAIQIPEDIIVDLLTNPNPTVQLINAWHLRCSSTLSQPNPIFAIFPTAGVIVSGIDDGNVVIDSIAKLWTCSAPPVAMQQNGSLQATQILDECRQTALSGEIVH